jgi:hypothetical protein
MRVSNLRRLAIVFIIIGAVAALLVAADRWRFEAANRTVEITIDQQDLADFARSYGYDQDELLREMHRAGLTSVAVYAEQGQHVNDGTHALAQSGQQLIDAARVSPLRDARLEAMAKNGRIDPDEVYLLVYDRATLARYLNVLRIQLEPKSVRLLSDRLPAIVAVKTQIDFFNSMDLGIPADTAERIRKLGLLVDPRVQNNERLDASGIDALFDQMTAGGRIGTAIFYGQGNEVLGYPFALDAAAQAFRAHPGVEFGDVEAYSEDQVQKGTDTLGREIPDQTVRVMAIPKLQLDKLDIDTVVDEYILGVRERNIRVIYLRPFPHLIQVQSGGVTVTESAEATNLDMLHRLSQRLTDNGFRIGRAQGLIDFKGMKLDVCYFLAALGCTAGFLLFLDIYGWARAWMAWVFAGITAAAFAAGMVTGHAEAVRKLWALGGALTFGVLAATVLASGLRDDRAAGTAGAQAVRGVQLTLASAGTAVLGGLFITGLLSQAAFMIEVQQFLGVKALLVVPPLAAMALYAFTPMFGARIDGRTAADAPIRVWMLAAFVLVAAGAALLVIRSGNQPDIGVSGFELNVRGALTAIMGARPRFKEFLIGYPAIYLLASLLPQHRRAAGWALVLAASVGLADILDTFSHIHTPLSVGILRTINGAVLGSVIGFIAQWIYRRIFARAALRAAA